MCLIPFDHPLEYNLHSVEEVNTAMSHLTSAIPNCLEIGHQLCQLPPTTFTHIKENLDDKLKNSVDERFLFAYCRLIVTARMVWPP